MCSQGIDVLSRGSKSRGTLQDFAGEVSKRMNVTFLCINICGTKDLKFVAHRNRFLKIEMIMSFVRRFSLYLSRAIFIQMHKHAWFTRVRPYFLFFDA